MADVKISQLPLAGSATDSDITAGVQSGVTVKQTNSALATYMNTKLESSGNFLLTSNNLSELKSTSSTARTNLNVNLQNCFNISSSPQITGDIFFSDGSGTNTEINGSEVNLINTVDQGSGKGIAQLNIEGTTPDGILNAGTITYGFFHEGAGVNSAFTTFNITDLNNSNNIFYFKGSVSGSLSRVGIGSSNPSNGFGQLTIGLDPNDSSNNNSLFQINSTTKGVLPAIWNSTQENTNISGLSSSDTGLEWFNSNLSTKNYWDGLDVQHTLTVENCIEGTNMTLDTTTYPGKVVFNASGGGGTGTQINGSFRCNLNTGTTTPTSSPSAVVVNPGSFSVINADGMSVTTATVDGVTTAVIQNTSSGGARWCKANFDIAIAPVGGSTGQDYTFTIFVRLSGGSFVQYSSNRVDIPVSATNYTDPLSVSSEVLLNTGDLVFLRVSSTVSSPPMFRGFYFNGTVSDLTVDSLPSTDALAQGTNNLYLSQNGGSTYQNVTTPVTVHNVAGFDTVGGHLYDTGTSASALSNFVNTVVITTTSVSMAINTRYIIKSGSTVTLTLPSTSSSAGIIEVFGTGSATWIISAQVGQTIIGGSTSGAVSGTTINSGTAYDDIEIVYAGDSSGQFNTSFIAGMSITIT